MEHQQLLNSKKEIYDRINSIHKFNAILNYDLVTKKFKLTIEGTFKDGAMAKGVLTQTDKQWIADLITTSITTAIKPLQADVQSLKTDMQNVKTDVKNLKDDMKDVKENINEINHRLDRIENCPTIKKELK